MIGTIKEYGGQRYECIAIVPHIQRDKGRSELAIWEAGCAHCGEPFLFKSPVGKETFMPSRRCPDHKSSGRKVTDEELAEAARKVAAREAEKQRKAEAARQAEEQRQEEARRKAEGARLAEERRQAEIRRKAEEARLAEEKRRAEAECRAELMRVSNEVMQKYRAERAQWYERKRQGWDTWELFDLGDHVESARGIGCVTDVDGNDVSVEWPDGRHSTGHISKVHKFFPLPIGCRVKHEALGEGTIVETNVSIITVEFDEEGRKKTLASLVTPVEA